MITLTRPEIEALIDRNLAAEAIEAAYCAVSSDQVTLPPVGHIPFPGTDADCHIKAGYIHGDPIFVVKIATGFPSNEAQGLPNGNGVSVVLSAQTGAVRAILHDEMRMTDIRTGIGGAIASRLLARSDSRKIGIVGTGIQAREQVLAHAALLGSGLSFQLWGRSPEKAERAVFEVSQEANISVTPDLQTLCETSDMLITTTGATAPIIKAEWIAAGTHITAIGADAPDKQELETALVAKADGLFADFGPQAIDHGDFSSAIKAGLINPDDIHDLGAVLTKQIPGRTDNTQITIADLTGLAVQDIAMARIVLNRIDAAEKSGD